MYCGLENPRSKALLQAMPYFTETKQLTDHLVEQGLQHEWLSGMQKGS